MRARGRKKISIGHIMQELRQQVVQVVKAEGTKAKEPFRAIRLDKWQRDNPGKNAEECGHLVKWVELPNIGRHKCVMLRTLPEDEYEVEVETSVAAQVTERFLNTGMAIRAGQVEENFNYLKKQTADVANHGGKYKTLDTEKPTGGALASATSASVLRGRQCQSTADVHGSSSEGDCESDGPEDDALDPLAGSILGSLMSSAASSAGHVQSHAKSSKAGASSKPAASSSSCASQNAKTPKTPKQRTALAVASSPGEKQGKARGKGKSSKLPTDVSQLLKYDGVDVLQVKFSEFVELTKTAPFRTLYLEASEIQKFDRSCKDLDSKLDKLHKSVVLIDNRIARRQSSPEEEKELVRQFRDQVKAMQGLASEMARREPDHDKCNAHVCALTDGPEPIYVCTTFTGTVLTSSFIMPTWQQRRQLPPHVLTSEAD